MSHAFSLVQLSTDKVQKEYNAASERVTKLQHDLEEQIHSNTRLLAENSSKAVALHLKDEAIAATRAEAAKIGKAKEALLTKLKAVEKQKGDVEKQRDDLTCAHIICVAISITKRTSCYTYYDVTLR